MTLPWFQRDPDALADLEALLIEAYPTLHAFVEEGECRIRGALAVVAGDRYSLEIALATDHPCSMPTVWETGGRIPREIDRHTFPEDGSLCLGTPIGLWIQLQGDYRIERVIEGPLRGFLVGNSLVEAGEPWPYGDRPHGAAGILEHFGELIGTSDPFRVGDLVVGLLQKKVRGHWPCPCGSGAIIRRCHRDQVALLQQAPAHLLDHTLKTIIKQLELDRRKRERGS